jgi:Cof subfamily protein (haloacid dehalogenase superfamily)
LNTLYVTDLDGTLLNDEACLTKSSYEILQPLIDSGLSLTAASARSHHSIMQVIEPLKLNLPILCHNGTFIYDIHKNEFIHKVILPNEDIECIIDMAMAHDLYPFIYTLSGNSAHVFYSKLKNSAEKIYYKTRIEMGDKRFVHDPDYEMYKLEDAFYISIVGPQGQLRELAKQYKDVENVVVSITEDAYYDNFWWLEIMPERAGKGNGIDFLRKRFQPKKVVCFGDNTNDITMFEKADWSVTVKSGVPELKKIADEIIGSNNKDAVAKYIKQHYANGGIK